MSAVCYRSVAFRRRLIGHPSADRSDRIRPAAEHQFHQQEGSHAASYIPPVVVTFSPSVTVQDPADVDDPRADLRSATLAASHDGRVLTVSATLQQPTSPTTPNWWRGLSTPRPGITWGLNTDPTSGDWQYVANLRGDPDLGAYGFVERRPGGVSQVVCPADASFDGSTYWLRFLTSCLDNPARVRFAAYVQLYDDSGSDIIGGDYAPDPGDLGMDFSDWLTIPLWTNHP